MIFTILIQDDFGMRLKCDTPNMDVYDHANVIFNAFPPVIHRPSVRVILPSPSVTGLDEETIYVPSAEATQIS